MGIVYHNEGTDRAWYRPAGFDDNDNVSITWRSVLTVPRQRCLQAYLATLHECGHAAFDIPARRRQRATYWTDKKMQREEEALAWALALRWIREGSSYRVRMVREQAQNALATYMRGNQETRRGLARAWLKAAKIVVERMFSTRTFPTTYRWIDSVDANWSSS